MGSPSENGGEVGSPRQDEGEEGGLPSERGEEGRLPLARPEEGGAHLCEYLYDVRQELSVDHRLDLLLVAGGDV